MYCSSGKLPSLMLACLLSSSFFVSAASEDPRKLLIAQIQQGDYISAYQTAESLFSDYAGDADFDYLYGLTARANDYHQKAIFAFERVLMAKPNHMNARLALAVEYYQVGNLAASETQFLLAREQANEPGIRDKVSAYLAQIDKKREASGSAWHGFVKAGLGYDSNVNFGLGDELYPIPIPGIGIADFQFPKQGEQLQKLAAMALYQQPLNKYSHYYVSLNAEKTFYSDLDQLEQSYLNLMAGYRRQQGRYEYNTSLMAQKFWFGSEDYHNLVALSGRFGYALNDRQKVLFDASYSIANNQQNDNLDLNSLSLKFSFQQQAWGGNAQAFLSARQEDVKNFNERSQHYQRSVVGIGLKASKKIADFSFSAGWKYEKSIHSELNRTILGIDGLQPFFAEKRRDHMRQYQVSVGYQINTQLSVNLTAKRNDKLSNQFLYSYDRNIFTSDIKYRF
ncbi:surface lipoprotein assembly modifier [Gayadomonas joobiniege]|uniref:surface lipoprotein assembly modifier n=1 Tax=Gayadomonas joobiniege TaxID=1234606 RepID=UPI00037E67E7|nr:surface lipoprotein assembly modifier [Gayadomonas joobiniege]